MFEALKASHQSLREYKQDSKVRLATLILLSDYNVQPTKEWRQAIGAMKFLVTFHRLILPDCGLT